MDDLDKRYVEFLRNPDEWPMWPICPVINRKASWAEKNHAGIVGNFKGEPPGRIYFVNAFDIPVDFPKGVEVQDYGSWEAMVQDGWRVD